MVVCCQNSGSEGNYDNCQVKYLHCLKEKLCCFLVAKSCLSVCDPMDCSTPGFPVLRHLPEFAQTHVH